MLKYELCINVCLLKLLFELTFSFFFYEYKGAVIGLLPATQYVWVWV